MQAQAAAGSDQTSSNVDADDVLQRELENVVNHRIGGQTATLDGQIWHPPEGTTMDDIPASDPVGDCLSELTQQAAQEWDTSDLAKAQQDAINAQTAAGRPWVAQIYEARYRGSWIESQAELRR